MKFSSLAVYSKAIIALAGTLVIVGEAVADGIVSQTEYAAIITSAVATVGVYAKRNKVV